MCSSLSVQKKSRHPETNENFPLVYRLLSKLLEKVRKQQFTDKNVFLCVYWNTKEERFYTPQHIRHLKLWSISNMQLWLRSVSVFSNCLIFFTGCAACVVDMYHLKQWQALASCMYWNDPLLCWVWLMLQEMAFQIKASQRWSGFPSDMVLFHPTSSCCLQTASLPRRIISKQHKTENNLHSFLKCILANGNEQRTHTHSSIYQQPTVWPESLCCCKNSFN